jgi:hypothetical protein
MQSPDSRHQQQGHITLGGLLGCARPSAATATKTTSVRPSFIIIIIKYSNRACTIRHTCVMRSAHMLVQQRGSL